MKALWFAFVDADSVDLIDRVLWVLSSMGIVYGKEEIENRQERNMFDSGSAKIPEYPS